MTEQIYKEAVLRNSQRVFLIALSFTRQRDDAEDVMQNVLLKLWKYRDRLQDPIHIDKWLTRVTVNECRSLLRFRRISVSYEEIEALCAATEVPEEQGLIYITQTPISRITISASLPSMIVWIVMMGRMSLLPSVTS